MNKSEMHSLGLGATGAPMSSGVTSYSMGQRVQIRSGALRGVQATILGRSAVGRVLLTVDCIGEGVYLQVTENLLEPVP